jgi:signal transduction histidine kinase
VERGRFGESAATAAEHPGAPATSLDGLLERLQPITPKLTRTSDVLLIVTTALLVLVDVTVWRTDGDVDTGRISTSVAFLVPVLGVLAMVAVALRRRHLTVGLVTVAASAMVVTAAAWMIGSGLPPSFAVLFALALLTIGVLRTETEGVAIALATLAAVAVAAESMRPMVSAVAYLLVVCEAAFAFAVGAGVYLRWSDWRYGTAAQAARIEERLEIARELHDLVGHYVSGMVVQAQAARHVAERRPMEPTAALERIEAAGTEAMLAMRRLVGGLRADSAVTTAGTWDDIDRLLDDALTQGQPVHTTIGPEIHNTTRSLVPSVQRIITESLTNARRHGHGISRIDVSVLRCDDVVVVTVHDNGSEATPTINGTYGIIGMRERAEALGGSLVAGAAPDGGWLVRAELPVEQPR